MIRYRLEVTVPKDHPDHFHTFEVTSEVLPREGEIIIAVDRHEKNFRNYQVQTVLHWAYSDQVAMPVVRVR